MSLSFSSMPHIYGYKTELEPILVFHISQIFNAKRIIRFLQKNMHLSNYPKIGEYHELQYCIPGLGG